MKKTTQLKNLICKPELSFLMECHNGMSAKIAEEAGFEGLWGSGLSISAACGVRDNNEMSWTQVLEVLEYISDVTTIPLLMDGDTGYGNFNNMRRLVKKLESRSVAGVCIEDKLFPKQNSFIDGGKQLLAEIDEFCGKIKAGKDAQSDDDFMIIARIEAFIAQRGLAEALKRAEAYYTAGADALLIHSKISSADEVLSFKSEWGDRCPVIVVPTKYYSTPTEYFRISSFSTVIWANHLMRTSIAAMQSTAKAIFKSESLIDIEDSVAPVSEVFRLQGADELKEAEAKYLPVKTKTEVLILAASRGEGFGKLTEDKPKTMLPIAGKAIIERQIETLRSIGLSSISIVRGYMKDSVIVKGCRYVDNNDFSTTKEVYSFAKGIENISRDLLISYGDILYHKHIPRELVDSTDDFTIAVDPAWTESKNKERYADYVNCDTAFSNYDFNQKVFLKNMKIMKNDNKQENISGEWIGIFHTSEVGLKKIKTILNKIDSKKIKEMRIAELFNLLIQKGEKIRVIYSQSAWTDIDELEDLLLSSSVASVINERSSS